jgi:replication-associated recombination protein RarA
MKHHGFGVGYRHPHDDEHTDVERQCLPDELVERRYCESTGEGWGARITARMVEPTARRRRGQRKRG